MSDDKDDSMTLGRRQALQLIGLGFTAAGVLVSAGSALAAPPPKAKPDAGAPAPAAPAVADPASCKDKAPIDDQAKQLRRALQYKEKSDDQAKRCDKCAQFEAKKFGECGSCKLFTGAVNPGGVCLSFAPLAAK